LASSLKTIDMIGLNEKIDAYLFLDYPRMGNKYVKKLLRHPSLNTYVFINLKLFVLKTG